MLNFADFDEKIEKELQFYQRHITAVNSKEIPYGFYEVKVIKLELTKHKSSGRPILICCFEILTGKSKGKLIFMSKLINNALALHRCNEFLRSLSRIPVSFECFPQYGGLIMDIFNEIKDTREYELNYYKDARGFDSYEINHVFIKTDAL